MLMWEGVGMMRSRCTANLYRNYKALLLYTRTVSCEVDIGWPPLALKLRDRTRRPHRSKQALSRLARSVAAIKPAATSRKVCGLP